MQFTRLALLALLVASALSSTPARAQGRVRVAVFKTADDDGSLADLAAALDPVVNSELSEVGSVQIAARPALDLPSMQLAIDCVGETADCLRASAKQADAEALLAPSVQRNGDAIVFTLLHFDPAAGAVRTVHRRYEGERIGDQALAGVAGMLAELFGKNEPDSTPVAAPAAVPATETPSEPQPSAAKTSETPSSKLPIAAILVGGVGVALIGTGVAFGLMSNASYDAYLGIRVHGDRDAANRAWAKQNTAKDQATVSNITIGVGAAALVGAGVLFYWQLKERNNDSKSNVALAPRLGPREVGLTLAAAWNDNL